MSATSPQPSALTGSKPKSRTRPAPRSRLIESMAEKLAASHLDIADDAICIQILIGEGFTSGDVFDGLDQAQERARELRVEAA